MNLANIRFKTTYFDSIRLKKNSDYRGFCAEKLNDEFRRLI